jgi:hypothetical protein
MIASIYECEIKCISTKKTGRQKKNQFLGLCFFGNKKDDSKVRFVFDYKESLNDLIDQANMVISTE